MKQIVLLIFVSMVFTSIVYAQSLPEVSTLTSRLELPDPLMMLDGSYVKTRDQWNKKRRPELKTLFQHYMYGYFPPAPKGTQAVAGQEIGDFFGGKATLREVTIALGETGSNKINLLLIVPNKRNGPAPVILGLNFCGNHTLLNDPRVAISQNWMPKNCPGVKDGHATEEGRGKGIDSDWAIEEAIARGYAVAAFYNGDVVPDKPDFTQGVYPLYLKAGQQPGPHDWGAIAAWAWGAQRVVDYLVTDTAIDKNRIALFGHSRNGKAAILAAAFDERIALVFPHQAGCGGTAPSRSTIGESVTAINTQFPHWFNDTFPLFNGRESRLPFDQHSLIALVAPRPVLLTNAVDDTWANPAGQFEMLRAADKVYRFLGVAGLGGDGMPETGKLLNSRVGYFIRAGKHSTTKADWGVFLDFADKHLVKREVGTRNTRK